MRPVNATVGSLLGFLHDGPQSGWDLMVTAEQRIGDFWSLTRSQVYRELATMTADGLVTAGETGPRERRVHTLTDTGRAAFAHWLSEPPGTEQIRYPLLLTMAFAHHLPADRVAEHLAGHRALHAARLDHYRDQLAAACAAGAGPADLVTLDFGLRYETAVLGWFDALPAEVRPAPARRAAAGTGDG